MSEQNENNGVIAPANRAPAKTADPLAELTPKQRLFLHLILDGLKTVDAYKKAGYEGEDHSAYVLKSRLDRELTQMALARGMSKSDLLLDMQKLRDLPVVDHHNEPITGIKMQDKLRLMALHLKALEGVQQANPAIMGIQINFGDSAPAAPIKTTENGLNGVVDAEVIQTQPSE